MFTVKNIQVYLFTLNLANGCGWWLNDLALKHKLIVQHFTSIYYIYRPPTVY
jgi:hypothetical protein